MISTCRENLSHKSYIWNAGAKTFFRVIENSTYRRSSYRNLYYYSTESLTNNFFMSQNTSVAALAQLFSQPASKANSSTMSLSVNTSYNILHCTHNDNNVKIMSYFYIANAKYDINLHLLNQKAKSNIILVLMCDVKL